jgi:hypothetical protein
MKKVKLFLVSLVTLVTLSIGLSACKGGNSSSRDSNNGDTANNSWIIGDWAPDREYYAEGEIITFNKDGSFNSGDDCTLEGTYAIENNTVYLNGKAICPGSALDDNVTFDEKAYSETITIQGNSLKGYRKHN